MPLTHTHRIAIGVVVVAALLAAGWLALDTLDPFNDKRFNPIFTRWASRG